MKWWKQLVLHLQSETGTRFIPADEVFMLANAREAEAARKARAAVRHRQAEPVLQTWKEQMHEQVQARKGKRSKLPPPPKAPESVEEYLRRGGQVTRLPSAAELREMEREDS